MRGMLAFPRKHVCYSLMLVACGGGPGLHDGGSLPDSGSVADGGSVSDGGASADVFTVEFTTSAGNFTVQCDRSWAPHGADRFRELVMAGFYDDSRFFRVLSGFVVQFGIAGDPSVSAMWA